VKVSGRALGGEPTGIAYYLSNAPTDTPLLAGTSRFEPLRGRAGD